MFCLSSSWTIPYPQHLSSATTIPTFATYPGVPVTRTPHRTPTRRTKKWAVALGVRPPQCRRSRPEKALEFPARRERRRVHDRQARTNGSRRPGCRSRRIPPTKSLSCQWAIRYYPLGQTPAWHTTQSGRTAWTPDDPDRGSGSGSARSRSPTTNALVFSTRAQCASGVPIRVQTRPVQPDSS